ncbi:MAG: nucleotide exchange factor GrpE [Chloroflexi bacterium]|nr:nucleotide exchange factor GrpE [Chloroflexota bacterium]
MTNQSDQAQVSNQESTEGIDLPNYQHLPPEEQIAALRNDLGEALKEATQNRDAAQRAQAEMVNYRKRTDEERISSQQYSNGRLIIKLLPVVDELSLAMDNVDQAEASNPWVEGVRLIQRKVSNLLESEGVSKIEAIGVQFDPLEHDAVGTQETDQCPPGHVVEVARDGYRLHDRVIQPAQVVVAREISKSN